ncbi:hypothetical protein BZA70DRAFT_107272 [Myxozyma melibiosi]|uniref:Polyprenal reductase n=1 Tax=Myxozyma melibiosi TaxID=54550 RepID=A0ABR1F9N5_9ASCO
MHFFAVLVQIVLYACTSAVLLCKFVPGMRYLLQYGKVLSSDSDPKATPSTPSSTLSSLLLWPLNATVPKAWFYHFYISGTLVSLLAITLLHLARSGVWSAPVWLLLSIDNYLSSAESLLPYSAPTGYVLLDKLLDLMKHLISSLSTYGESVHVSYESAQAALFMFMLQSLRRWYECLYVEKMSQVARIRLGHYIVGHLFYFAASCALWCDALEDALLPSSRSSSKSFGTLGFAISLGLYATAGLSQYKAHAVLASLKKYSPPPASSLLFRYLVCPHYGAEVIVYLSLAIVCGLTPATVAVVVWTFVNLSASAEQSRAFYVKRFGEQSVAGKWSILIGF